MAHMLAALLLGSVTASPAFSQPFRITVVDSQTGRGVPLVELTTVSGIVSVTDSAGVIAFDEPGLMNLREGIFFTVKSHGYSYPKDGFGVAGTRLIVKAGGAATIQIDRTNIAQRLYRITGGGIYRDSVLLGDTTPMQRPVLNGQVLGQDSVQNAVYKGKLYWFWGDTAQVKYPLGNFAMSGATSKLPPALEPETAINLEYFTGPDGFSRGMCPIKDQPGPVWCDGFVVQKNEQGQDRMLCHWARMKSLGEMYEQGFARWNDEKEVFEPVSRIPLDAALYMRCHPVKHTEKDGDYWYFPSPFPLIRCRADERSLLNPAQYESFTCLKPGSRYDAEHPALDRDADGKLIYAWKRDTAMIGQKEQHELVRAGHIKADEARVQLLDAEGKEVIGGAGTVYWNDYRKAWIMIVQQVWGASMCGETWFAQAPSLTGPWSTATKIVTHDDYSFYNVAHHPEFDADGGRTIYFEGTYTMSFSGTKVPTPRYDYNQIMYKLDLGDPRLVK